MPNVGRALAIRTWFLGSLGIDQIVSAAAEPPPHAPDRGSFHPRAWPNGNVPPEIENAFPALGGDGSDATNAPTFELLGRWARFSEADTWFPIAVGLKGGDDATKNLIGFASSWTDGRVWPAGGNGSATAGGSREYADAVRAYSGCVDSVDKAFSDPGTATSRNCSEVNQSRTAQGYALAGFDADTLDLRVVNVGAFTAAATAPFHGRYPGAGFVVGGKLWFYSTYATDDAFGACGNWCKVGPLVGFRWAEIGAEALWGGRDNVTWTEPNFDASRPLFSTAAGDPCAFGGARAVDFGASEDAAPAGYRDHIYIVAHCGESANWLAGSALYAARISRKVLRERGASAVNERASWEILSEGNPIASTGGDGQNVNRMGTSSVVYVKGANLFLLFVSTPSAAPGANPHGDTRGELDSYVLVSRNLVTPGNNAGTGWKRAAYLSRFGLGAYFLTTAADLVNVTRPNSEAGLFQLDFPLFYAANFDKPTQPPVTKPDPPGSAYGLVAQKVRLTVRERDLEALDFDEGLGAAKTEEEEIVV